MAVRALATEMLTLAVAHARYAGGDRHLVRQANTARRWLLGYPAILDIDTACDIAGMDATAVQSSLRMQGVLGLQQLPPTKREVRRAQR
jgi:hypothetical protein